MKERDEELEAALDRVITDLMMPEGYVLNRFVVVAEGIDTADGGGEIFLDHASGMLPWDKKGMLQEGIDMIQEQQDEEEEL
jgi:hypothetical protein